MREIVVTAEVVTRLGGRLLKSVAELGEARVLFDLLLARAMQVEPEGDEPVQVPAIFSGAQDGGRIPLLRVASMALGIDALAIGPKQDDPRAVGFGKQARHAIGPKQDDPRAVGIGKQVRHAIGPKQDDPRAVGMGKRVRHAIGPKQDDPRAVDLETDDPVAIGPKQDDPRAIGPKQDDPGAPPKFTWGVIMAERGEPHVNPGGERRTVTDEHVGALARWLGELGPRLTPDEQALLDLLLIRGGEAPPEDPHEGHVPALSYDPDDEEDGGAGMARLLARGLGIAAIGPKQDDPGAPPKPEQLVVVSERGTPAWSRSFALRGR